MLDIFIEPLLADDVKELMGNTIPGVTGPNPSDVDAAPLQSNPTSVPDSYEPQALSEVEVVDTHSYVGHVIGGKYRLVKKVGQGGMGEVYLGLNDELGQRVAVKFLSRKFADDEGIVQRFLNEARSYCRVNHPNAVTLLEYGQHDDDTLYIITEFVEGMNLAQHMKEHGFLEFSQIISLTSQLCEVLSSAHEQGVIHRDLKPDNLMLPPASRGRYSLKVLDFGIAKIIDEEHDGPNTETGSVFGTPEFMSPEQARGEAADPRSDIYAVGIILFYMLTGKLPFKGKNKLVVLNKQLNYRPPRPSEVRPDAEIPLRLEAVVMKCLNKGRNERYASADDLLDALEELHVPSGSGTGKVGVPLLNESSEVSVNSTPDGSLRHATVQLGAADSSRELDPMADTLASTELSRHTVAAELESVEMWREQPTTENPAHRRSGGTNHFSAVVAVTIICILALVMGITLFGREGVVETEPDIESILATGQVVGLLSAIEEMLAEGNLEAAQRSLGQTDMWLGDDELPDAVRTKRDTLRNELKQSTTIRAGFGEAMRSRKCEEVEAFVLKAKTVSLGLHNRLERRAKRCQPQVIGGARPDEVDHKATSPRPAKSQGRPIKKTSPPTSAPTPKTAVKPQVEPSDEAPDSGPSETEEPDGTALPPKHL